MDFGSCLSDELLVRARESRGVFLEQAEPGSLRGGSLGCSLRRGGGRDDYGRRDRRRNQRFRNDRLGNDDRLRVGGEGEALASRGFLHGFKSIEDFGEFGVQNSGGDQLGNGVGGLSKRIHRHQVERDGEVFAVSQDAADGGGAAALRTMFDEDANAVLPRLFNHGGEVQGVESLFRQGVGNALFGKLVGFRGGVRVEADAGRGRGGAGVQFAPGFLPGSELRAVDHQIVVDPLRARFRQVFGNAGDDVFAGGMDRGEAQCRVCAEDFGEFGFGHGQTPGLPAGSGHLAEQVGGFELRVEGVEVVPGAEGRDRVGLAGTDADGGGGLQAQNAEGKARVHLAQEGTGPERFVGVGCAAVGDPGGGGGDARHAGGDFLDQIGERAKERLAHAGVGCGGSGEHEGDVAREGRFAHLRHAAFGACEDHGSAVFEVNARRVRIEGK